MKKINQVKYYVYYTLAGRQQFPYYFKGTEAELDIVLKNLIHLGASKIYCKLA